MCMCMCLCLCLCVCAFVRLCLYVCMCVCVYVCMRVCVYVWLLFMFVCNVYVCTTCVRILRVCMCVCVCIMYACVHVFCCVCCVYVYVCVCVFAHVRAYVNERKHGCVSLCVCRSAVGFCIFEYRRVSLHAMHSCTTTSKSSWSRVRRKNLRRAFPLTMPK